jgi:pyrroloquinoline-quinone synthase
MTSSTTVLDADTNIKHAQKRLIAQLAHHPFLARCRSGQISLEELKNLLIQQGLYSSYFTRYLCALMSNLPSNTEVFELAENLLEELGFAPDSPTPHYLLYRDMLQAFDLTLEGQTPNASTQQLIDTMFQHCRHPDPAVGLGALCLGAEGLVPFFYSDLMKGFASLGIDAHTVRFFQLHIACDDEHAQTLARMMLARVEEQSSSLERIVRAGEALVNARCAFLDGIQAEYKAHRAATAEFSALAATTSSAAERPQR